MRDTILSHEFADLVFDHTTQLIEEIWKPTTTDMSDKEYKAYQALKVKKVREVSPKFFLCDTKNFFYPMSPEMQEWTDEKLNKFWLEIGLSRFAMIVSKGEIEQISLELAMTERSDLGYAFHFFDEADDARAWLLNT